MFGNMTRAKMLEVLGVVPGDGAGGGCWLPVMLAGSWLI